MRGDDEIAKLLTEKREYEIPAQTSMDLDQSSLGDITVKYIFSRCHMTVKGIRFYPYH